MLPFVTFAVDQFEITAGASVEFRSSPPVIRSFCGRCGSPLSYRHADEPHCIDIMTCSLDDPEGVPATFHIWVSQKLSWIRISDDLPAFQTTRAEPKGERGMLHPPPPGRMSPRVANPSNSQLAGASDLSQL